MTGTTTQQELVELERRYWQALTDGDINAALELTDDPCLVTGAQGLGLIDHQTFSAMMQQASWTIDRAEIADDVQVRMLGADTAVVAYTVREELTVDGGPVSFEAADTSTWVRRGDRWVCAAHTESLRGDPFGRDRRLSSS